MFPNVHLVYLVIPIEQIGGSHPRRGADAEEVYPGLIAPVLVRAGAMPTITRAIGIEIGGKLADEPGYLIDNGTYVRAAYLIGLVGGQVTGHGDHIKITLPPKADPAAVKELEAEIAQLKADLAAANKRIANAKKALS